MEWGHERMGEERTQASTVALHGVLLQKSTEKADGGWWESGWRGLLRMGEMRAGSQDDDDDHEIT